jgi:hypothetical protein
MLNNAYSEQSIIKYNENHLWPLMSFSFEFCEHFRQTQEMARAVDGVHVYNTEQDINQLAAHHFEDQNLLQGKWNSEVDTLKETQRKEYREWLMKMLEEHQTNVTLPTPTYVYRREIVISV